MTACRWAFEKTEEYNVFPQINPSLKNQLRAMRRSGEKDVEGKTKAANGSQKIERVGIVDVRKECRRERRGEELSLSVCNDEDRPLFGLKKMKHRRGPLCEMPRSCKRLKMN